MQKRVTSKLTLLRGGLLTFTSLLWACDPGALPAGGGDTEEPGASECLESDLQDVYADSDGDGYGDPAQADRDCNVPAGYVTNSQDCNDGEPLAYEGASEMCGDKVDNDCAGGDTCLPSLTGEWSFSETDGEVAADSSGNLMEGILRGGLVHTADPALAFDGNDDYVEIPHQEILELSVGTLSFWFMPTEEGNQQSMVSKDSAGNDAGGHLSMYINGDRSVRARLQSNNETYEIDSEPVTLNEWHHVVFVFGGNEGMTLFVDDVEAGKDPYTGGIVRNLEPLVIGAGTDTSGDLTAEPINKAFQGVVSRVEFYDRQLLREEITSHKLVSDPRLAP